MTQRFTIYNALVLYMYVWNSYVTYYNINYNRLLFPCVINSLLRELTFYTE